MSAQRPANAVLSSVQQAKIVGVVSGFKKSRKNHSSRVQPHTNQHLGCNAASPLVLTPSRSVGTFALNSTALNVFAGEIVEVKDLKGIRVIPSDDEEATPTIEYLVEWKDGSADTWEPVSNLAGDLLRSYEQRWWNAVKKGDEDTINIMMDGGALVLARTVDENRRSALHFAAGLGKAPLCQKLLQAGAEVNLGDKEGYTALHMASGYLHSTVINVLLVGGADPEQQDRQGRSPLELVESLRAALPVTDPSLVSRRLALEEVLKVLTDNLFEDVEPVAVLDCREGGEDGTLVGQEEYLVQFPGEEEAVWVPSKYISEDVVEDYRSGLEYAEADCILDVRNRGDSRTYLVRWFDDYPDSWEPEENVSEDMVAIFEGKKADTRVSNGNGIAAETPALQPV